MEKGGPLRSVEAWRLLNLVFVDDASATEEIGA